MHKTVSLSRASPKWKNKELYSIRWLCSRFPFIFYISFFCSSFFSSFRVVACVPVLYVFQCNRRHRRRCLRHRCRRLLWIEHVRMCACAIQCHSYSRCQSVPQWCIHHRTKPLPFSTCTYYIDFRFLFVAFLFLFLLLSILFDFIYCKFWVAFAFDQYFWWFCEPDVQSMKHVIDF